METIVNLTPHTVSIYHESKEFKVFEFYPCDTVMRLENEEQKPMGKMNVVVPVYSPPQFKGISPSDWVPEKGTDGVIVSMLVAQYIVEHGMMDGVKVYVPDTGPAAVVRDDKGAIKGTTRLCRYK